MEKNKGGIKFMNDYVFNLEIYDNLTRTNKNETVVVSEKDIEKAYDKILKRLKNDSNQITIISVYQRKETLIKKAEI